MQWRFIIPAVLFAALFGVFGVILKRTESGNYDPKAIQSPLIGKPVPQFKLSQVEDTGKFVDSQSFAGKPYIINVWATWCAGCRDEHEALMEISRRQELPIVGLDWNDDLAQAQKWLNVLGNPYVATGFDNNGKVAIDLGVYGAPETFLVDAQGIIRHKHTGPLTIAIWERDFMARVKGAAAP
jgi:cytochrome c biogenesis protein CcmG/thiol:disulfide interchange protein DsbE